jgi:hypothetical protein
VTETTIPAAAAVFIGTSPAVATTATSGARSRATRTAAVRPLRASPGPARYRVQPQGHRHSQYQPDESLDRRPGSDLVPDAMRMRLVAGRRPAVFDSWGTVQHQD